MQETSEQNTAPMQHIETITLSNGLEVEFYDMSRKVAGDRWLVKLLSRIPVAVTKKAFEGLTDPEIHFKEYMAAHGDKIFFEQIKERNFIDEKEKDALFCQMQDEVKLHLLRYMEHANFADGVLKREIKDFCERRTWYN